MNYKKLYDSIIKNRQNNPIKGYKERHHIIPKCLGGTDEQENLVDLTAREHFLCHYILTKMYDKNTIEWYKMHHAFMMMKCSSLNHNRYFNSHLYSYCKESFSEATRYNQLGYRNSRFGSMWIYSEELRQCKTIDKDSDIPIGWVKGRVIDFDKRDLNTAKRNKIERDKINQSYNLLRNFIDSDYNSLNSYCKNECDISLVALTKKFNKHIIGYSDISFQGSHNIKEQLNNLLDR